MALWLTVLLGVALVAVPTAILRNERRRRDARATTIELMIDRVGLHRTMSDGRIEGVSWVEVNEVEVLTANSGPHRAHGGVVIIGDGSEHGCLIPLDQIEESGALEQLTRLPGFDVRRLIEAMERRPPSRTTCWQRSS